MAKELEIHCAPGQDKLTVVQLEGNAPKQLDEKAPVAVEIKGTIGAVQEYLSKRVNSGQFEQKDCHILVNRDKGVIHLIFNERDAYRMGQVAGVIETNPKFDEFGINNSSIVWQPAELGLFIKMNRTYFPDRNQCMELVSTLMNFTATVNSSLQNSIKQNGDRGDEFRQTVNSNLPESFKLMIPVLKGGKPEEIDVETFAKISGRDVTFVLISPDAAALIEEIKATEIDAQLTAIREIAPDIAIIEV